MTTVKKQFNELSKELKIIAYQEGYNFYKKTNVVEIWEKLGDKAIRSLNEFIAEKTSRPYLEIGNYAADVYVKAWNSGVVAAIRES